MEGLGGFREGLYDLGSAGGLLRLLVFILAVALFVHLAARMVVDKDGWLEAVTTAVLGILASFLAASLIRVEAIAHLAGLAAFVGVTALVYKVKFPKALAIGIVAWVLYILAGWLMGQVLGWLRG